MKLVHPDVTTTVPGNTKKCLRAGRNIELVDISWEMTLRRSVKTTQIFGPVITVTACCVDQSMRVPGVDILGHASINIAQSTRKNLVVRGQGFHPILSQFSQSCLATDWDNFAPKQDNYYLLTDRQYVQYSQLLLRSTVQ